MSSPPTHPVPAPPLSIAPMMDRTDRHFRFFFRQISRRALLYTEMLTAGAVLHGDREWLLGFDPQERPLALQLGGDDPGQLAECARIAQDWGYDEVNLNVGCPSDRVQKGRFGACLMAEPQRVARAVTAMAEAASLPVTVKHRIGIDDKDRYEDLLEFVSVVSKAPCSRFSVHARKAWLEGLSPKENRTIPPLRYGDVYRLKEEMPHLAVEINGGILTVAEARDHLRRVDAVMVGRAAYDDPYEWASADRELFAEETPPPSRQEVVESLLPYVEEWCRKDIHLKHITRHVLGLFAGRPGAKAWKRHLSESSHLPGAGPWVVEEALARVPREVREERPVVAREASEEHAGAFA